VILEWDIPFMLIPSVGLAGTSPGLPGLPFNDQAYWESTALGIFQLDPAKCQAGAARRITRNNIAQADGEITHRKFKTGFVIELNAILYERIGSGAIPACGGTLRQMGDMLSEYLEATANNDAQLLFWPSRWPATGPIPLPRMMDMARAMGPSGNDSSGSSFVSVVTEKDPEGPQVDVTFAFLSPLPYLTDFMDYPTTPDATVTWASGAQTVPNDGNTDYYPTVRVWGPADGFELVNYSILDDAGNPLTLVYDDTLPGAIPIASGNYLEIDTFRNSAQIHLPGGGTDNGLPGIDVRQTDYWTLAPGNNDIFMLWYGGPGTQVEIVYRNAWV
jgi:hypothetical protein